MKSMVVGFRDVGQSLRTSKHRAQSFELENKYLHNELDMAKEEVARLKSKIILTKKFFAYHD
jgi:hypothetical protein